eukprot:gene12193-2223_t
MQGSGGWGVHQSVKPGESGPNNLEVAPKDADQIYNNDDVNIKLISPLLSPALLLEELPLTGLPSMNNSPLVNHCVTTTFLPCLCAFFLADAINSNVVEGRNSVGRVLDRQDDRLIVVVGPCSIHDTTAALEYAATLKKLSDKHKEHLLVVMRVYFEKPRTTVGWKGLLNDPFLDGTFQINKGLRIGRQLLMDVNNLGLPVGCEFLDMIMPQFHADLVSWGAIGARTTESQVHRELASGLSMPIGFKNGTDGNTKIAVDAIRSASSPHSFLSVTKQGLAAIVHTTGNQHCHVILRGSSQGTNFSAEHVEKMTQELKVTNKFPNIMVDCSHGNSNKDYRNQPAVAADIARQIVGGNSDLVGVMIESHIKEGRQDLVSGQASKLQYGQSITDGCINVDTTATVLQQLVHLTTCLALLFLTHSEML